MEKDDLIVPTFVLALLTFVWVTGTPTIDSVKVEEPTTFEVASSELHLFGGSEMQFREYSPENITCTSEVELMHALTRESDVVIPVAKDGEKGACAVIQTVEKTVFEVYGIEVVL